VEFFPVKAKEALPSQIIREEMFSIPALKQNNVLQSPIHVLVGADLKPELHAA